MAVKITVGQTGMPAPDSVAAVPDYHAAAVHAQSQIQTFLAASGLADEIADNDVGAEGGERSGQPSGTDWSRSCV
ncbi:hypothetical protein [Streptomyces chartreusis]|uniref:hypothetical protein n=1 Tax=Streptomyces chartreusis TaxID=1969 RepID=UPI003659F632